jgi:hypothetical protein
MITHFENDSIVNGSPRAECPKSKKVEDKRWKDENFIKQAQK